MSEPWMGDAIPMTEDAFRLAASQLRCEEAAIQAIWEVESGKTAFRSDGSVDRRFEPHKMPGARTNWRDSMKLSEKDRESAFLKAFARRPEDTLRATSLGGPQIMGEHAVTCGFTSAVAMTVAFADNENSHLAAFLDLVFSWKLDSAIRAHDWLAFARAWNGSGQPKVYAKKIEAAYRKFSNGKKSPEVLKIGDRGEAVTRLQKALRLKVDGAFGPVTKAAVMEFQKTNQLTPDGVVGAVTWAELAERRDVTPVVQAVNLDTVTENVGKVSALVTTIAGLAATLREIVPQEAMVAVVSAAMAAGVIAIAAYAIRWART